MNESPRVPRRKSQSQSHQHPCPLPEPLPTFCHFHQSAVTAADSSATVAAFASHRSGFACALAAPFGVRHRFAACPPSFTHARRTRQLKVFCHSRRRHPALASVLHFVRTWICYGRCLRFRLPPAKHSPSSIRITPLLFANQSKCKEKQPPHPKRRAAVAAEERSICVFQLSGLCPGWLRRLSR